MRRVLSLTCAALLALSLGACSLREASQRILDAVEDVNDIAMQGVGWANTVADKYCLQVSNAVAAANNLGSSVGATCKVKNEVSRVASGVASYCNNPSGRPADVLAMVARIKQAARDARAVVAAGC